MSGFFMVLMAMAMVAVVGSLGVGLFAMIKGGEFNKKYGNKLMQLRVTLQGVAIVMFIFAMMARGEL
jgi:hypothetical protein